MKLSRNSQIIIAVAIIIVVAIGIKVFTGKSSNENNANTSTLNAVNNANTNTGLSTTNSATGVKSIDVPSPSTVYTATTDGFAANFPTTPKVNNTTYRSNSAGVLPLTEYTEEFASGLEKAWYKVSVYHYPATYTFSATFLDDSADVYYGSVNAMHPGTTVADKQTTQFLGNPAIEGTLTVPVYLTAKSSVTTPTNNYAIMTVKGTNLYIISAYGTTQEKFNSLKDSFKFQ
jgi:hypothetical protein